MTPARGPFLISGQAARPGRRTHIEVPIARLMSGTPIALPVVVLHGRAAGPVAWINAAIHGDELCGVDIVRRVLEVVDPRSIHGTLVAVPIVNVTGFNTGNRYFPDRRDLNRSFPGSPRGSLAARVAHLMLTKIVSQCEVGIDLHTGSGHRANLPQVRANLDDAATLELTEVFGAPVTVHARTRDGSLRQAATDAGATVLLYEAGEALRFSDDAIKTGTLGVLRVLHRIGMISEPQPQPGPTLFSRSTRWIRASTSGIVHLDVRLGDTVRKGDEIAVVRDPFGKRLSRLVAPLDGIVIGCTRHPLVHRGDAAVHIAQTES